MRVALRVFVAVAAIATVVGVVWASTGGPNRMRRALTISNGGQSAIEMTEKEIESEANSILVRELAIQFHDHDDEIRWTVTAEHRWMDNHGIHVDMLDVLRDIRRLPPTPPRIGFRKFLGEYAHLRAGGIDSDHALAQAMQVVIRDERALTQVEEALRSNENSVLVQDVCRHFGVGFEAVEAQTCVTNAKLVERDINDDMIVVLKRMTDQDKIADRFALTNILEEYADLRIDGVSQEDALAAAHRIVASRARSNSTASSSASTEPR